jgi:hypothetical protein
VPQSDSYSKCHCKNCGGRIEFPSEGAGRTVPCPHCNWPTLLVPDVKAPAAAKKGGKGFYRIFAVAATVAIISGAGFYRYWYQPNHQRGLTPLLSPDEQTNGEAGATTNSTAPAVPAVPPDPWNGLMAGPITLEKVGDGNLIYAIGKLTNASDHQRFGVKVELDVFDAGKQKVGTATDYTLSIDPGKAWKFKALVTDRAAATAKLTSVKEN